MQEWKNEDHIWIHDNRAQHIQCDEQQLEDDECHYVNLIDTVVQEEFNRNCFSDPLETFFTNSVDSYDIADDAHLIEICPLLDSS